MYLGSQGETVLDLATYARNLGYKRIEIYTNGTLLTPDHLKKIRESESSLAITLYSSNSVVHDSITQVPGSFKRTLHSLEILSKTTIDTRVEIPLLKQNQNTVEDTIKLRESLGFKGKVPDPIRPIGRGTNADVSPDVRFLAEYGLNLSPNFQATVKRLATGTSLNPCLWGKLAILESGDVLPCVFSRNQVLGNLHSNLDLQSITEQENTQRIWGAKKDGIMVCRDCEYRYLCGDCRPLSHKASLGLLSYESAPYPRCSYNPYTGTWKGGLWRVGSEGQTFYDTTFAPDIHNYQSKGEC